MSKRTEMTYEELMAIYRQESKQNSLAKVTPDLYRRIADYLDAIESRCAQGEGKGRDPSGMLQAQMKTAVEKSSLIYEARMRKIVLMALNSAFGAEPRLENGIPEELEAFKKLRKIFQEHRDKTLRPEYAEKIEPQSPERSEESTVVSEPQPVTEQTAPSPKTEESAEKGEDDTILVKILEDLPAFAGTEKNYHLMKEDIISLPRKIAEILVRHNKAVEISESS